MRPKNVRKKSSEEVRKSFFYIRKNIVTKKWGKKTRETIYPGTHEVCDKKMLGKKSSEKSAKKRFLYSQEYRDKIMGEKNA